MEAQSTAVYETGTVGELQIENLGDLDVFIQAGDILKGGRQDRVIGVDFILGKRSGRVSIPSFCVEQYPNFKEHIGERPDQRHRVGAYHKICALMAKEDEFQRG